MYGALRPVLYLSMIRYLEIGKIVTTHGVNGEMKLYLSADSPESLFGVKTVFLDSNGTDGIKVRSCRSQKNMLLLRLHGIDTVEQAHALIGRYLWADRDEIAKEEGTFFVVDLIGLEVVNSLDGSHIGVLNDVITGGVQSLYSVRLENGEDRLVPAVPAFVKKVSPEEGKVWIEPIRGLFDDAD